MQSIDLRYPSHHLLPRRRRKKTLLHKSNHSFKLLHRHGKRPIVARSLVPEKITLPPVFPLSGLHGNQHFFGMVFTDILFDASENPDADRFLSTCLPSAAPHKIHAESHMCPDTPGLQQISSLVGNGTCPSRRIKYPAMQEQRPKNSIFALNRGVKDCPDLYSE